MSRGDIRGATGHAVDLVAMNALDENHQALLIRLYRMAGDDAAAQRQQEACQELFARELGVAPGPGVASALREPAVGGVPVGDEASVRAVLEAGEAAVAAGAVESGVQSLRTAVAMADGAAAGHLGITARLSLAEALIHSLRGQDEEGTAILHLADEMAAGIEEPFLSLAARAELGYVDFLRGRYERSERWLSDVLTGAPDTPALQAKALAFLGSVASDRADYPRAQHLFERASAMAQAAGDVRRGAYIVTMLGRLHLLRGDLDRAAAELDRAISSAESDRWLAFLPWPQALRGEVEVARGQPAVVAPMLAQAFARACQLGDPCWEGMALRVLALVAEAEAEIDAAFAHLADARVRCNRLADPYVWLDVAIDDAQCRLGLVHGHARTGEWIDRMHDTASRTGMRELVVHALAYRAVHRGQEAGGDATAARLLAADIENPTLEDFLDRWIPA